jgi:hypothetical protein
VVWTGASESGLCITDVRIQKRGCRKRKTRFWADVGYRNVGHEASINCKFRGVTASSGELDVEFYRGALSVLCRAASRMLFRERGRDGDLSVVEHAVSHDPFRCRRGRRTTTAIRDHDLADKQDV